jgi:hypothetical protein
LHDQNGDRDAGLVPSVMTIGFFVPLRESQPKKKSRFESKDRSSNDLATEYFRS